MEKSYKVKTGVGQWVVYHYDTRREIYVGGAAMGYQQACDAVRDANNEVQS